MAPQHLQRQDHCFLQRLGLSLEVEDVDSGIVTGRGHEGVLRVIVYAGDSLFMESHGLVGFAAEVEIKTEELSGARSTLELSEPTMMQGSWGCTDMVEQVLSPEESFLTVTMSSRLKTTTLPVVRMTICAFLGQKLTFRKMPLPLIKLVWVAALLSRWIEITSFFFTLSGETVTKQSPLVFSNSTCVTSASSLKLTRSPSAYSQLSSPQKFHSLPPVAPAALDQAIIDSPLVLSAREYFQTMSSTCSPWVKAMILEEDQSILRMGQVNCRCHRDLLLWVSQTISSPDSSPLAKQVPSWVMEREVMGLWWPTQATLREVGKGRRVEASGSLGMRESGSMLSFFFLIRGQRQRSRHRWNRSWMSLSQRGTCLILSQAAGMKLQGLSSSSISSHSFSSSSVSRYSLGGLQDSLCPGSFCFMGAMLTTPRSMAAPLAHASYIISSSFSSYSSWFHLILPVSSPSRILLIFICSHLEGMKLRLAGGCAWTGKGSLQSQLTQQVAVARVLEAILPLRMRSMSSSCLSLRRMSRWLSSSRIVLHQSLFQDFLMNYVILSFCFSFVTFCRCLSYPKCLNSSYHPYGTLPIFTLVSSFSSSYDQLSLYYPVMARSSSRILFSEVYPLLFILHQLQQMLIHRIRLIIEPYIHLTTLTTKLTLNPTTKTNPFLQTAFINLIIQLSLMQNFKSERQRQLDNVQKELLTNYYLQKYNSIMSQISKQPENTTQSIPNILPKPQQNKSQRLNFKNMILMKKNQNQNLNRRPKISNQQQQLSSINEKLVHKFSSREEQQNQKTMRKLQQSIINQLYKPSPSRLEQGTYRRIEINSHTPKNNQSTDRKIQLHPVPLENIEVTDQEEPEVNQFNNDDDPLFSDDQRISQIKKAIKMQFDRRKDKSMSPKRSGRSSDVKSSKISDQVKINSPKKNQKSASPSKFRHDRKNLRQESGKQSRNSHSQSYDTEKQGINSFEQQKAKVHFSKQIDNINEQSDRESHVQDIKQQQVEFMPPTSSYYKSPNLNLVQDSFKYQDEIRQHKDDSEKAQSVTSSKRSSKNKQMVRNDSKKSVRSKQKSDLKDNSKMEMSFVSKMSMLSSNQGLLIKEKIEKELYDNELGPYQSSLFNILELIEKNPRSGPVYAVGQKTLEDRRNFEQRRISQQSEISQLRRNIDKLKRKATQIRTLQREDQIIRNNQLQILRLIRKLSTNL